MIYLVDPTYNPNFAGTITAKTKLAPGVSVAKFLGARGSRNQLERISGDLNQIARNLYLHAELLRRTALNDDFQEVRVSVAEGLYVPALTETPTPDSVNDYKQTGRAVVYQVIGQNGKIDIPKTYDLAVYWKDYCDYEKIILDYDTFDPSGDVFAQIVVVMPNAPQTFDLTFQGRIETRFNTKLQSSNELIEILV